jgi:transcriptional regulator with XRE-family HTH domain
MDRLAELRERRALTLRELAKMSGVAADTINQIELGHRKPRPSTLRKLARALEVDVEELMSPKAEAPSSPIPESLSRELREWLEEQGLAARVLSPYEERRQRYEQLAESNNREAVVARFLQEFAETYREKEAARNALSTELAHGGELVPKIRGDMAEERTRGGQIGRFRRELNRSYDKYFRDLELFQLELYDQGKINDFFFRARGPEEAAAKRKLIRDNQEEAFEAFKGA